MRQLAYLVPAVLLVACGDDGAADIDAGPDPVTWNISASLDFHSCGTEPPATLTLTVADAFGDPVVEGFEGMECGSAVDLTDEWSLTCNDGTATTIEITIAMTGDHTGRATLPCEAGDGSRAHDITVEID